MFEVLTRDSHYGVLYIQCPHPCCEKTEDMLIPCVCLFGDKERVGACHRITNPDLITLAEFLYGQARNTSGTSHVL